MIGALIGIAAIWALFGTIALLLRLGSEHLGVLVCIFITVVGAFIGWAIYMG